MNKKREVILLVLSFIIFSILSSVFISAANTTVNTSSAGTAGSFDKSYNCLKDKINSSLSSMTTEELAFSLLALSYDSAMQNKLKPKLAEQKSTTEECWPKTACSLRDTSLVLLAYNQLGQSTTSIENWLLNQTISTTELTWYLEIDSSNRTQCTISYDTTSASITVNEDKKITGNAGSCLKTGYNGFWLEVIQSCYGKEFKIKCDNDFLTTLVYKKRSSSETSSTYYVSSLTHTGAPNSETTEKVESKCFKSPGQTTCNYEGSLWAALALNKKSKNIDAYIPYLITLSNDNRRYLPSAFLYAFKTFDEYLQELASQQNNQGYWQISETSRRYYDTAIALYSLYGRSSEQAELARTYLLTPTIQANGCWNNNLRDTAFLLYAMNPRPAYSGGGITPSTTCEAYSSSGYQCMTSSQCQNINGISLPNFPCTGGMNICCNQSIQEQTCAEKSGETCETNEECSDLIKLTTARGTTACCLSPAHCQPRTEQVNECEEQDTSFTCSSSISCGDNEEEKSYGCINSGDICCGPKPEETKSYWWLWLLIILVILIILAIWKRDQLKIWWFKIKSKFSKSPVQQQQRPGQTMPPMGRFPQSPPRPGMMPPGGIMPRRIIPRPPMQPPNSRFPPRQQPPYPKDKELDDTLKKLKDMSK